MVKIPNRNKTLCIGNEYDGSQAGHFSEEDINRVLSNLKTRAIRYSITDDDIKKIKIKPLTSEQKDG